MSKFENKIDFAVIIIYAQHVFLQNYKHTFISSLHCVHPIFMHRLNPRRMQNRRCSDHKCHLCTWSLLDIK